MNKKGLFSKIIMQYKCKLMQSIWWKNIPVKKTLLILLFIETLKHLLIIGILIFQAIPAKSIENVKLQNSYPDYAYEFVGKDKCENFNRKIFIFNSKLNKYLIRPLNIVYASVLPKYGMDRLQSAFTNMEFPIRFTSCLLQKDFKSSRTEAVRFLTNTTLGVGGLYDPAKNYFKIEPVQEDMAQALAHLNVKKGPYLFLPIISPGNIRDHFGTLLDVPLNPSFYLFGIGLPITGGLQATSLLSKTASLQSIVKTIDTTYADPYEVTKKLCGVDRYIKNSNLDRNDVFEKQTASQEIVKINNVSNVSYNSDMNINSKANLKADIELKNYNPQGPLIDAMRTALFDNKSLDDSLWAEISVWNRNFDKQIKTSSVKIDSKHPKYKYRYILQKDKTAPLAIIYPSIGESITSHHSKVLAKILYDEGYSVLIMGSQFQWEFVKSMPDDYRPGLPYNDAHYLRIVTYKILNDLQGKKAFKFNEKIIVGSSFGAMTTLFVAAQEENEDTLGISNYIAINPPVEIFFALNQIDKYSQDWKNNPNDLKLRVAITAEKVIRETQKISDKTAKNMTKEDTVISLPFTDDEAGLITGFVMKQKLSDVIFTIEKGSKSKKSNIYESINNMNFYDYTLKYLQESLTDTSQSNEKVSYDASLYSLADFLQNNKKYKIYHAIDDYYVNQEQLIWLKNQTGDKTVLFSNGSHLGFLYRKEFLDEFIKDIKIKNTIKREEK